MTEPGGGFDLQALTTRGRRDGEEYVIDGQKTFITNSIAADLVLVAVRIDGTPGTKGSSLISVEKKGRARLPARPAAGEDRSACGRYRRAVLRPHPRPG